MLREIFTLCRSIELAAEAAYRRISNQTEVEEQKSFWLDISRDEKRHATYWEQLLELQEKGSLKNPFDKPELVFVGEILSSVWERNRELANQFHQIKTLRGLIPICANCKQVRNDQGYWEQIEAYVGRYSETTFTHSICPECTKQLYPGIPRGNL